MADASALKSKDNVVDTVEARDRRRHRIVSGPIGQTTLWLAIPVVGEQLLNTLVSFLDVYLAGNLGAGRESAITATAAVGLAAYIGWLAGMVTMFVGAGTSAMVSRAWGAGRQHAATAITNQSLVLAGALSVVFASALGYLTPYFVDFVGLDESVRATAIRYLRLDVIGHPGMAITMIGGAALRGSGDMQTPLRILVVVNVVNVVVSIWLTYAGPGGPWGLTGIVTGTIVARYAGVIIMVGWLATRSRGLRVIARQLLPTWKLTRRIFSIGGPAAADGLVMWCGHVLFLKIIGLLDDASFAAHVAGIRVESLTYLSATAFGAAAATMIGQNLGAGNADRARQAGHAAVLQSGAIGILIGIGFVLFAEPIMLHMNSDPAVREIGTSALMLVGFFQLPLVMSIVYIAALRGAGQTRLPLLATLFGTYVVRLPLAYLFAIHWEWGLFGAWMGMCVDMLVRGLFAAGIFLFASWETTRV